MSKDQRRRALIKEESSYIKRKEEPQEVTIKEEEEQLPVSVLKSSTVSVKTEESSLFQTEFKEEEPQDINTDPHLHPQTEGDTEYSDNDEERGAETNCSDDEDFFNHHFELPRV
uniref:Uncharacterized protein n=1 Tax=Knipowitschia caucasica TaxID=637954 RepID=A0AAV2JYK4_KNICA